MNQVNNYNHKAVVYTRKKGHSDYWAGVLALRTIAVIKQVEREKGKTFASKGTSLSLVVGELNDEPFVMLTVNEKGGLPGNLVQLLRNMGVRVVQAYSGEDPAVEGEHSDITALKEIRAVRESQGGKVGSGLKVDAVANNIAMCGTDCADAETEVYGHRDVTFRGNKPGTKGTGSYGAGYGRELKNSSDPFGELANMINNATENEAFTEDIPDAVPPIGGREGPSE